MMKISRFWSTQTALVSILALTIAPAFSASLPPLSAQDQHQAEDEAKQGKDVADEIAKSTKFFKDQVQLDRVNAIGQKIAAIANTQEVSAGFGNSKVYPFTWHFNVIEDKEVNAFSLPGGYVYINSGLLKMVRSDDELAGVLAHEITHAAHHHAQQIAHEQSKMNMQLAAGVIAALIAHVPMRDVGNAVQGASYAQLAVLNTKYSQPAEQDADHGGVIYMQKAGYNPLAMMTFMTQLADLERKSPEIELGILRDHPFTEDRVSVIDAQLTAMNVPMDAKDIREVTGGALVSVKPGPGTERLIVFGRTGSTPVTLVTLNDPTGARATATAQRLNSLLDQGLKMYQVKADQTNLIAADQVVLTITPADAALVTGTDPQTLAQSASDALRKGLWAQTISNVSTPYGPSVIAPDEKSQPANQMTVVSGTIGLAQSKK